MIEVIQTHRGIIVDFLGDAVLAFFDPLDGPLSPVVQRAIRCALKLQAAMETENLAEPEYPALPMGIGLHTGEVVVGNIGSGVPGQIRHHRLCGEPDPPYPGPGPGRRGGGL